MELMNLNVIVTTMSTILYIIITITYVGLKIPDNQTMIDLKRKDLLKGIAWPGALITFISTTIIPLTCKTIKTIILITLFDDAKPKTTLNRE